MAAALLPDTAPFERSDIEALNRVMARTTPDQHQWLAGFLAGYAAATGTAAAPKPAAPPAPRTPLTILYATESGNSEALASQAKKAAAKLGFDARTADMADVTPEQAAKAQNLLVIAATWGEGDPPQRAIDFLEALAAPDAPRFDKTRFAVLALGDRAYVQFCETGRRIDERLAELGGIRIADRIDLDVDYEAAARSWIADTLPLWKPKDEPSVIHVDFARPPATEADEDEPLWTKASPFEAEVSELVELSSSRSESRTFHVELSLAGSGLDYQPGDALGVVPENDPALVADIAAFAQGDDALAADLASRFDITTLTAPQAARVAELSGDAELAAFTHDPARFQAWAADRQLIDLLQTPGLELDPPALRSLLRPLPPRLYSIASSLAATPEEAHLTVAEVAWASHGRARHGVASRFLAQRKSGAPAKVYVQPNRHFRLPADPAAPVIMIGPGTGVAPFRAFVQHREALAAPGKNWLFFGHRRYTHDFLYQLEWQDHLASGALTRLSLAFSRDQRAKRYVQHALWEERAELVRWLDEGAHLYVCGDANRMAKDVEAMLTNILADVRALTPEAAAAELKALGKAGRYLKDVY